MHAGQYETRDIGRLLHKFLQDFFFLLFYFTTAKAVNYGAQARQDYAHAYSRADWPDLKKQLIN